MATRWCRLYRGTPAELALEDAVAALGVPYRTQLPGFLFGLRYFPDFVLPTLGLVIEVDDASHSKGTKPEEDAERTATIMREWGYRVVRCTNEEALEDPHGVIRRLLGEAGLWPVPSRLPLCRVALPAQKKAPQKGRREAKAEVVAAQRKARRDKPPLLSSARDSELARQ